MCSLCYKTLFGVETEKGETPYFIGVKEWYFWS